MKYKMPAAEISATGICAFMFEIVQQPAYCLACFVA